MNRRSFLEMLSTATSAVILTPIISSCSTQTETAQNVNASSGSQVDPLWIPRSKPENWDPVAFNRQRGNAGAIPSTYLPQINGADGPTQHIGKHLPYIPRIEQDYLQSGCLPIMWGDPAKGYTRHPNAIRNDSNQMQGHWYNWVEIQKAVDAPTQTIRSTYPEWPGTSEDQYAIFGDGQLTDDNGKNTIYLASLPTDIRSGDTIRVWAHCLTHGEYVDFITL